MQATTGSRVPLSEVESDTIVEHSSYGWHVVILVYLVSNCGTTTPLPTCLHRTHLPKLSNQRPGLDIRVPASPCESLGSCQILHSC